MRDELNLIELVDRYLRGELDANERAAFEDRMQQNAELRDLVSDQRDLQAGMARLALRPSVEKAYRSYKWGKWAPGIGGSLLVALLTVGVWMLMQNTEVLSENSGTVARRTEQPIALSDTTGTGLPALVMTIDPNQDTTLITPHGLVLDIPQGAFVDGDGRTITKPVRVTLLEAIDGITVMKAGLSTMSGDTLLETGGMFYLDAQVDGEQVGIDPAKPLTVMVPSDKADPRMRLYEGVMTDEGIVDWRNPQPLPRTLVPVDISTLDFYPPGYLNKVAELGKNAMDKAYTDSLYFSFSAEHIRYADRKLAAYQRDIWGSDTAEVNGIVGATPEFVDGAFLFTENCASCHKPARDMVGPALIGARGRWEGKGDIYAWIKNSQAVIKAGNPYAIELFKRWNKSVMTPQDLSDAEIDKILQYVEMSVWPVYQHLGIDPAKVQAIWNERFNGTNFATREFEERMWEIHHTCDNAVLDLYANNLDKNLGHLDSMAVRMGHGAFASFALRNDGRVELPMHAAERLRGVYTEWSRRHAEVARKTHDQLREKEDEEDRHANARQLTRHIKDNERKRELFEKEYNANLRSAYKQLGYPSPDLPPAPPRAAFAASITATGWWNVDKAVDLATTDRSSMSFTDDQTGKTAILTYTPISIAVEDRASFDELRVYLIPHDLNSYQRVTEQDGRFSERLNALFRYDLVCIGRKDGKQYAASQWDVSDDVVQIQLEPASDKELKVMLRPNFRKLADDVADEAKHLEWLELEAKRQQAKAVREEFRNALMGVVFPCFSEPDRNSEKASIQIFWERRDFPETQWVNAGVRKANVNEVLLRIYALPDRNLIYLERSQNPLWNGTIPDGSTVSGPIEILAEGYSADGRLVSDRHTAEITWD